METIEEKLKALILSRYGSMYDFSKQTGIANSTVASIMTRGVHKTSVGNIIKICKTLDISADELARDKIVPNGKKIHEQIPMKDIDEIVKYAKINISSYDNLTIDGEPLTAEDVETLLDAMELCLELVKRKHHRKASAEKDGDSE